MRASASDPIHKPPNEPGYLLSAGLVAVLVALLWAAQEAGLQSGSAQPGRGTVFLGLYVMAWGFMFLSSYYFSQKALFLRALAWVCVHLSWPSSRKMAFFYFVLAFGLGSMTVLKGLAVA